MPQDDNTPITTKTFLVWGGAVFTLISSVVYLVWFVANVAGNAHRELEPVKIQVQVNSVAITDLQERDRAREKAQGDLQRSQNEMQRKLDVVVTLLERIDKKVGTP